MILPKQELLEKIVSENLIENAVDLKEQVQPASIELTLEKVMAFTSRGQIDFDNKERKLSELKELPFDELGWLELESGAYKIIFREKVKIPKDAAGVSIMRSSLARCGCKIQVGFWDPGYEGKGEAILTVHNSLGLKIKKNAKVVQIIFLKLSSAASEGYSGRYLKENL